MEERMLLACRIARGEEPLSDADERLYRVVAAAKNYSARGRRRYHWYRLVWRAGKWVYFSERPLARGTLRAVERRDSVEGVVVLGELIAQHDHGGPVTSVWLVTGPNGDRKALWPCEFVRFNGQLRIQLPDGARVDLPDPRR